MTNLVVKVELFKTNFVVWPKLFEVKADAEFVKFFVGLAIRFGVGIMLIKGI